jgi:hypothetical protein
MLVTSFLSQAPSVEVSVKLQPQPTGEPKPEVVKLHATGSLEGIRVITHSLHVKRFAEVREWSTPQPTGQPGEYISVLFKSVWLE